MAIAWGAMGWVFDRHIERRVQDELTAQAVPLLAGLSLTGGAPALEDEPADPRFGVPASGIYWQVNAAKGQLRSRSLWDSKLPAPAKVPADAWGERKGAGPFGQRLLLVERQVQLEPDQPPVTVQLGYDLARLAPAQREFGREMALFLALLWAVLSIAAWVQVTLGLRPLGKVEGEVRRLRRDATARLAEAYPRELLPLTQAIDALADAREADVVRARRRAADLAHGLKTPLAALAVQSAHAREAGATDAADGLDAAIAAVRGAVDGELARTRIGLVQNEGRSTAALPLAERLVQVLEATEAGERIAFSVEGDAAAMLPLAGDDAAELLGPLLENAARHARRRVEVTIAANADGVTLSVADDGPGLDAARHGDAVLRGARLDTAGDGHGLGLAIARELTEATGGKLTLAQGGLGGLEVRLAWASPA
ncbi:MAG: HAMP domain-containing histidine kinase [Sphingomonadales bacterium]|nr:MAG: HAMP domain-containing histidine kinase [Sphingomonadales bacterium]